MSGLVQIRAVYDAMTDVGYPMPSFESWRARLMLFVAVGPGGIAAVADEEETGLWWINVFTPGCLPNRKQIRILMVLCKVLGCKILASETVDPRVSRLLGMIGFQRLNENLYSIRTN